MKKIYTIIATVGIVASSFAQMATQPKTYADRKLTKTLSFDMAKFGANKNLFAKTAAVTGGWFNYGSAIDVLNGGVSDLNSNYLFPDSLGYGEFGAGTFAPCWVHHLGDILDVKGVPFGADPLTAFANVNNAYVLDSMSIVYAYTKKHPNPAIVDTLIITVFNNSTAANLAGYYFTGATAANYATDTLSFKAIKYTQATNSVNAASTYKFKVLLTAADSSEATYVEKRFKLPTAFTVPSGKLLVADVQFKPGYTYTIGTQIDYVANSFFFTSVEEKGASTFPTFYDCNSGSAACDWNNSSIVTQDVRYNMAASWNGLFIPSYAYTAPFGFEHHLISYRLTETVGVNELEKNGFALGQNVPNPFTTGSAISYQLVKDAKSVLFTVTDVMGRVISTETASNSIGIHTVNIGSYAAGVYYYSLNVDGNVITKKMIAQ
jgi:hypothetical protein